MATNRWRGDYIPVAQVVTLTVGSNTTGQTFVTTMNGKSYTYVALSTDTTSTIAAAIQAILSASGVVAEFTEVTWTVSAAVVTGTAAPAGVPFTVSVSGTGTYTLATVTASTGPNHVDEAHNWSLGTVPGATDDVLIDRGADLLWGFNNLSAAAYTSFRVKASFSGNIGLPFVNSLGYIEYRTRSWPMNTAVPVTIGEDAGQGPSRVNLNCGASLNLTIFKTQGRLSPSIPVVNVYGSTTGTFYIESGDLGLASDDDTLTLSGVTGTVDGTATVTVGKNATVATLNQNDGTTLALGTVTTGNVIGGTLTLYQPPTTITADASTQGASPIVVDCRFTGTAATMTFRGQGPGQQAPTCECGNDPRAKTFTNHTFTGGAILHDPEKTITYSNAGTWDRASLADSDLGSRFSLLRS